MVVLTIVLLAAGETGFAHQPTPRRPATASFAGEYATKVALKREDCGGVTVQDNPTVVTHDTASAAEATVDKASSTTRCRFVVTWSGTRA